MEALATLESRGFLTDFIEEFDLLQKLFRPDKFERDDPLDTPTLLHDSIRRLEEAKQVQ